MNVVDSSGWLEYFGDGPNADFFADAIAIMDNLLVPTVSVYEVYKRVLQQRGEDAAQAAVAIMIQGSVVDLDLTIALGAADLSNQLKLAMADSIILATARAHNATLWTQDADFETVPGVKYVRKS